MTGLESAFGALLVAAIMCVVSVIQSMINNRAAMKRQEADWKRQDIVAQRAQLAANEAKKATVIMGQARQEQKDIAAAATMQRAEIKANLEEVHNLAITTHSLVNSALTAVKQSELDGLVRELALMRQIPSTPKEDIESIEGIIAEKKAELNYRASKE